MLVIFLKESCLSGKEYCISMCSLYAKVHVKISNYALRTCEWRSFRISVVFSAFRWIYALYDKTVSFVCWIRNGSVLASVAYVCASPSSFCHILDFCVCESDCVELRVAAIQCAYYLPAARADTATWLDTAPFQYWWAFVRQCLLHTKSVALYQVCSSQPWHNWPSQTTWHWFEPSTKANPSRRQ